MATALDQYKQWQERLQQLQDQKNGFAGLILKQAKEAIAAASDMADCFDSEDLDKIKEFGYTLDSLIEKYPAGAVQSAAPIAGTTRRQRTEKWEKGEGTRCAAISENTKQLCTLTAEKDKLYCHRHKNYKPAEQPA